MTQQTQNDSGAMSPSLETKLQQFVVGLTPEEAEQLGAIQGDDVTGMLSPSLRDKVQQVAEELTPEEQEQLRLLLARADVAAATGAEADTQGFAKPLYEGDHGYKGRPGTDPTFDQPGGSNLFPYGAAGAIILLGLASSGAAHAATSEP
jgi:hypothetical protein